MRPGHPGTQPATGPHGYSISVSQPLDANGRRQGKDGTIKMPSGHLVPSHWTFVVVPRVETTVVSISLLFSGRCSLNIPR